jgi:hypothetical protein
MSNPAQRLHALLKLAKRKELAANKMLVAWRNVLGLPAPENMDDLIVMSKLARFLRYLRSSRRVLSDFPIYQPSFSLVGAMIFPQRSVLSTSNAPSAILATDCLIHC